MCWEKMWEQIQKRGDVSSQSPNKIHCIIQIRPGYPDCFNPAQLLSLIEEINQAGYSFSFIVTPLNGKALLEWEMHALSFRSAYQTRITTEANIIKTTKWGLAYDNLSSYIKCNDSFLQGLLTTDASNLANQTDLSESEARDDVIAEAVIYLSYMDFKVSNNSPSTVQNILLYNHNLSNLAVHIFNNTDKIGFCPQSLIQQRMQFIPHQKNEINPGATQRMKTPTSQAEVYKDLVVATAWGMLNDKEKPKPLETVFKFVIQAAEQMPRDTQDKSKFPLSTSPTQSVFYYKPQLREKSESDHINPATPPGSYHTSPAGSPRKKENVSISNEEIDKVGVLKSSLEGIRKRLLFGKEDNEHDDVIRPHTVSSIPLPTMQFRHTESDEG